MKPMTKFVKFPEESIIEVTYRATGDTHRFICVHHPRTINYGFIDSNSRTGQIHSADWMDARFDFIEKVG